MKVLSNVTEFHMCKDAQEIEEKKEELKVQCRRYSFEDGDNFFTSHSIEVEDANSCKVNLCSLLYYNRGELFLARQIKENTYTQRDEERSHFGFRQSWRCGICTRAS